jgi:hypothetical protein
MNDLDLQTHGIVVYVNRKRWRLILMPIFMVLLCVSIVGMDVFVVWAFWNHFDIDIGVYVVALLLLILTVFMGWALFVTIEALRRRGPAMIINSQGFTFYVPLRFAFLPQFRQRFLPWEEIEWIGSYRNGIYIWFSLCLKDPAHYWSLYGNGPFRAWHRDAMTGAHINLIQYSFSMSAWQILQQVEENYSAELLKYGVKVRH